MIRINLLPHREQKKLAKQRRFIGMMVFSVIAAGAVVLLGFLVLAARLDSQNARNDLLRAENQRLDQQIAEIDKLKTEKQAMLVKKSIIERLQNNRTEAVRLMDQLARQTPDGIYLREVKQSGSKLVLSGITQSNARVSSLMQNLTDSLLFEQPVLEVVKAGTGVASNLSDFTLSVEISRPKVEVASGSATLEKGGAKK
ncbi:PilN domain-containing protein [Chitinilyticum piscinae]|uniref:PilN domain-containing protein n=1 Tax=Chitinilyticum piscinae TaxID=2866724 RepID=A0A8J7FEF3_9NEIS|nr:PilN domain-containing protein [Chitinilyticum piscinae]MBE9607893.1 PilN domain-containing protein [Chitinilyticum piscinae]